MAESGRPSKNDLRNHVLETITLMLKIRKWLTIKTANSQCATGCRASISSQLLSRAWNLPDNCCNCLFYYRNILFLGNLLLCANQMTSLAGIGQIAHRTTAIRRRTRFQQTWLCVLVSVVASLSFSGYKLLVISFLHVNTRAAVRLIFLIAIDRSFPSTCRPNPPPSHAQHFYVVNIFLFRPTGKLKCTEVQ